MRLLYIINLACSLLFLEIKVGFGQYKNEFTKEQLQQLKSYEKKMQAASDSIINAQDFLVRFKQDSILIRNLVQALKISNSFWYNFDSVHISKLYAPDSSFKIFTWQVSKDFAYHRQKGAIQVKTDDGSLKLFPLFDVSDFTRKPNDSIRTPNNWIGAIYYKILQHTIAGKNYYTLLGSDENNERSNKKWIEVLSFNSEGKPEFGAPIFSYPLQDHFPPQPCYRFSIDYKKNGGVRLNYDKNVDAIIFDHLVSESNQPLLPHTLVPYGDFEGFKFVKNKWVYTDKPFEKVITEKPNIMPKPILQEKEN